MELSDWVTAARRELRPYRRRCASTPAHPGRCTVTIVNDNDPAARVAPLLTKLRDEIGAFSHCPVCRKPVPPQEFRARDLDTFWTECAGCRAEFGLRSCGTCGERYPVLSTKVSRWRPGGHGDILDRAYGSELLAEPCRNPAPDEPPSFVCDTCGTCSASNGC